MADTRAVRLSLSSVTYLLNADYLPEDLRDTVQVQLAQARGPAFIEVDAAVAERFRSSLTERLAQVGFDKDYALTAEGVVLEDLIDSFGKTT